MITINSQILTNNKHQTKGIGRRRKGRRRKKRRRRSRRGRRICRNTSWRYIYTHNDQYYAKQKVPTAKTRICQAAEQTHANVIARAHGVETTLREEKIKIQNTAWKTRAHFLKKCTSAKEKLQICFAKKNRVYREGIKIVATTVHFVEELSKFFPGHGLAQLKIDTR